MNSDYSRIFNQDSHDFHQDKTFREIEDPSQEEGKNQSQDQSTQALITIRQYSPKAEKSLKKKSKQKTLAINGSKGIAKKIVTQIAALKKLNRGNAYQLVTEIYHAIEEILSADILKKYGLQGEEIAWLTLFFNFICSGIKLYSKRNLKVLRSFIGSSSEENSISNKRKEFLSYAQSSGKRSELLTEKQFKTMVDRAQIILKETLEIRVHKPQRKGYLEYVDIFLASFSRGFVPHRITLKKKSREKVDHLLGNAIRKSHITQSDPLVSNSSGPAQGQPGSQCWIDQGDE